MGLKSSHSQQVGGRGPTALMDDELQQIGIKVASNTQLLLWARSSRAVKEKLMPTRSQQACSTDEPTRHLAAATSLVPAGNNKRLTRSHCDQAHPRRTDIPTRKRIAKKQTESLNGLSRAIRHLKNDKLAPASARSTGARMKWWLPQAKKFSSAPFPVMVGT